MPTYVFNCNDCDCSWEEIQRMNDLHLSDCPSCGQTCRCVPCVMAIINTTPQTLGALADKNRREMGEGFYQDRMQSLREQQKEAAKFRGKLPEGSYTIEKPAVSAEDHKLNRALQTCSPEARERYVFEGKKPFGA